MEANAGNTATVDAGSKNASTGKIKRPVWVWVISIFYLFSALISIFAFQIHFMATKINPDPLAQVDLAMMAIIGLVTFLSAVSLFFLRKIALYFFAAVLVTDAGMVAYHLLIEGFGKTVTYQALGGKLLGWAILIIVCFYIRNLGIKGIAK